MRRVNKRLKFAMTHLGISICVGLLLVCLVFLLWYPSPLNQATGVLNIFLMMVIIDIILGPFLSWMVYKEGKKTLIFDLTIIIALQLSALTYGIYNIMQARPVWIVYSVDRFDLIRYNEIYNKNIAHASKEFQQPSWFKPQYVATQFSVNLKQRETEMFEAIFRGIDVSQRPERYIPLSKVKLQIEKRAQNLNELNQFNDKAAVQKVLSKYPQATAFVPLKANAVDMTVLINKEKGEVVKIVDLRPWK
ncbi:type IV pilin accessory protein [Acinetobacter courvalinii]|uniref:TfpX/TfpZ family type IV pilin accessory protein n=1 Tax=Acinetobacter courvalinii TaxID=280147 RepID=UPI0021D0FB16|nr:TfpX/TfpZ family type IV pilin accessory protein [Acinetobacter courvalinii]MCU4577820.1 type IV pilin accessory protein [Acinetobacter courvalinii]